MVVLTFSGPAVADAQPLVRAAALVGRQAGPRVVVMPQLAGIPERIDQMLGFAREGRVKAARALAARVTQRHRDLLLRTAPSVTFLVGAIDAAAADLDRFITAAAERDANVEDVRADAHATGTALSSAVMAAVLKHGGTAAERADAADLCGLQSQIASLLEREIVPVVPGAPVPMLVAARVSAAIGARELHVWTDAEGVRAADPSAVPSAHIVRQLSFAEAVELAKRGAASLHAGSVELAWSREMPILVRSVRRPDRPGTAIDGRSAPPGGPAALACRRGAVALRFSCAEAQAPELLGRILDQCAQDRDPLFAASDPHGAVVGFANPADAEAAARSARAFAHVTPLDDVTLLSAVGENIVSDPGVAAGVLDAVREITVHAAAQHGRSLTLLIDDADAAEAMRRIYDRFFTAPEAPGAVAAGCEA